MKKLNGKTGSVDHPSPERDILGKLQNNKAFTWSIRIGPKWSGGPFFPACIVVVAHLLFLSGSKDIAIRFVQLFFL